ncbi:MAG: phosphoribosylaminoimidazolesuccinocarboxamide synthase [Verrucomicrobiota bacterium]|nr:phosphoribosylaminoimidazolesuccinocarboxamide synthase [Verrucomicrobiota bacterium]
MLPEPLTQIDLPGIPKLRSGKVREVFDLGNQLLFVATDRISAFDCILPNGIPYKGEVLNTMSAFWFRKTNNVVINHMKTDDVSQYPENLQPYADILAGRSMLVTKLKPVPVECVVRGYLTGSAWKEYKESGRVCGIDLPEGLEESCKLEEPIFTPAAKNDHGHDENITFDQMIQSVGVEVAEKLEAASFAIFNAAQTHAQQLGLILADTKFEYGLLAGETILMDECLTPDSSRFWLKADYKSGQPQQGMDKQFVRNYLESVNWDKTPPAPALTEDVVMQTARKYLDVFQRITGKKLPNAQL